MSESDKTETVRETTTKQTEVVATPVTTDASQAKDSVEVPSDDVTD